MITPALTLKITTVGLQHFTAAQAGQDIDLTVSHVGFTDQVFVNAPTLTGLPGELRRLDTISGAQVGDNVVAMTVRDMDAVSYTVRGIGLYLTDGTLLAVYGQADPIVQKSPLSTLLVDFDVVFPTGDISQLTFGDTNFLNPPATTATAGVVRLLTAQGVTGGNDGVPTGAAVKQLLATLLPIGMVMLWSGVAAGVPAGWAICDGRIVTRSDGAGQIVTPDLRDHVPVGAGGTRNPGDQFGASSKTVNTAAGGGHTPAGSLPPHTHSYEVNGSTASAKAGVTSATTTKSDVAGGGTGQALTGVTLTDPGHTHTLDIIGTTAATAALALTMQAVPDHQHGVTVDVTQPSLALFYVMKV